MGDGSPASGVQGWNPGKESGDEVPRSWSFFVKLHILFALKYNKQQLLLLLDKIISKILGDITMDVLPS